MRKKTVNTNTTTSPSFKLEPKTENQRVLLEALKKSTMVVATGPAGTGKTFVTVTHAALALQRGEAKRLVLTRPNLSTGRSLGFFPGTIADKLEPWLQPMISVLKSVLGTQDYQAKVAAGVIQLVPLETIRGASYTDSIVLIDEAQNLSYEEIKAVSTRLGEGSRMVFMGDPQQRDTRESGLVTFKELVVKYGLPVPVVTFTVDDIVRSDLVGLLVRAYYDYEK